MNRVVPYLPKLCLNLVGCGIAYAIGYSVSKSINNRISELEERIDKIDELLQYVCEDFHKSRIELEGRVEEVEKSRSEDDS